MNLDPKNPTSAPSSPTPESEPIHSILKDSKSDGTTNKKVEFSDAEVRTTPSKETDFQVEKEVSALRNALAYRRRFKKSCLNEPRNRPAKKSHFTTKMNTSSDRTLLKDLEPQPGPSGVVFPPTVKPPSVNIHADSSDNESFDDPQTIIATESVGINTVKIGRTPVLTRRPEPNPIRQKAAKFLRILFDVPENRPSHSILYSPSIHSAGQQRLHDFQQTLRSESAANCVFPPSTVLSYNVQETTRERNETDPNTEKLSTTQKVHMSESRSKFSNGSNPYEIDPTILHPNTQLTSEIYLFVVSVGVSVFLLMSIFYVVMATPMCPMTLFVNTSSSERNVSFEDDISNSVDSRLLESFKVNKTNETIVVSFVPNDDNFEECIGVILSSKWILISSLCVVQQNTSSIIKGNIVKNGTKYKIKRIFLHLRETNNQFSISDTPTNFETLIRTPSIALIRLEDSLKENSTYGVARLPDAWSIYPGLVGNVISAVKRSLSKESETTTRQKNFFQMLVNVYPNEVCRMFKEMGYINDPITFNLTNPSICAGNVHGFTSESCSLNQGNLLMGPLVVDSNIILGIFQSNRNLCGGRNQLPVVYLNVFDYSHWITTIIKDNS